ncbi:MAG: hypothetical protein KDD41_12905, partial [Flavobacteriales bacterium]|nr:hypothetical protein [Flavobacteriales bacterium]
HPVFACDLCTVYLGIQPNDFQNSFSLRYRHSLFRSDYINQSAFTTRIGNQRMKGKTNTKHGGKANGSIADGERFTYTESYNSYDVLLNFYLGQKWQLNTSMTFSDNYIKQNDSIVDNVGGIGDLKVVVKHTLHNSVANGDSAANKFTHRVNLGAGVTLPTGTFNKYSIVGFTTEFKPNTIVGTPEMELDPHLQAGTGSFAFLGLIEYLIKWKHIGLNSNASYQVYTTNKNNFRLANRLNITSSLFSVITWKDQLKWMPNLGIAYEKSDYDQIDGKDFIDSGGEAAFVTPGMNLYFKKLGLTFNYYLPVVQKLYGIQPLNNRRIIAQLSYYF